MIGTRGRLESSLGTDFAVDSGEHDATAVNANSDRQAVPANDR